MVDTESTQNGFHFVSTFICVSTLCSGTPQLLDCITLYLRACVCLYINGLRMCADSTCPSYLTVSGRLAGPQAGGGGERGTGAACLGSCSGGGLSGRTCCCHRLCGSAGYLKNALLRRCLGCYVADCVRHGKKWPYAHRFPPGRLAPLHRWHSRHPSTDNYPFRLPK